MNIQFLHNCLMLHAYCSWSSRNLIPNTNQLHKVVSFFLFQSSHVTALFSCAKMASVFLKVMFVIIKKIVVMVLMRKAATLMNVSVRKLVAALKIVRIFLLDTRWISTKYGVRKCKFLILTCFLTTAWLL